MSRMSAFIDVFFENASILACYEIRNSPNTYKIIIILYQQAPLL